MKNKTKNDIRDLFSNVVKRSFPVIGTFIFYLFALLFFFALLIVPGVLFLFYYSFSIILSAIGDFILKENTYKTAKALGRSYEILKGNLIRYMLLISTIFIITIIMKYFAILFLIKFDPTTSKFFIDVVSFCVYDFFVIGYILSFIKISNIQNDLIEEEARKNAEDAIKMNAEASNNLGSGRKK